jgi:hypothetical protein
LLVLSGPTRLLYVSNKLLVSGNATPTVNHIAAHELLFRYGIVSDLLSGFLLFLLALALYRLMKGVDQNYAALIIILGGLVVAPIYFVNSINDAAALLFARGADFLSALDKPQRGVFAMLFLRTQLPLLFMWETLPGIHSCHQIAMVGFLRASPLSEGSPSFLGE